MSQNLDHLREWVGRKEVRHDVIAAWPITALAATVDDNRVQAGDRQPVPPGWHWIFFLEAKVPSELGNDGHPQRGGFLPPVPLPRRMWAGGRLQFVRPLLIGEHVTRESEILSVEPKSGRTGNLVFVTVRQTIRGDADTAIVEEQDIVYREAAQNGDPVAAGKPAPSGAQWTRSVMADSVMLFRYSALTFNGHRIHYDKDYAIHEEHYPGLVVHGPLQATLLLDLCRQHAGRAVKKFEYRAQYPLFVDSPFSVNGKFDAETSQADVWTANEAGSYAMRGTASF